MTETAVNAQEGQRYLTFFLGQEEYAIPLLTVREVLAMPDFTPVPQTPPYFLGVMNLRGRVLSVMDLRLKMNIKPEPSPENAVILCQVGDLVVGIAVDSVNSVLAPSAEDLSPAPENPAMKTAAYVTGVYRRDKHLVLLLNIGAALSLEDVQVANRVAKAA